MDNSRIQRIAERIMGKIRHGALNLSFDKICSIVRTPDQFENLSSGNWYGIPPFPRATDEEIQEAIECLCSVSKLARADALPKSRYKWFNYKVIRDSGTKIAPPHSSAWTAENRLLQKYGKRQGICNRCGGQMLGKGRHAKSKRGHTREVCDLQMTKRIIES